MGLRDYPRRVHPCAPLSAERTLWPCPSPPSTTRPTWSAHFQTTGSARKIVEVWTPEATFPAVETERVTWHPAGAAEPLVIPLVELFALA